MKIFKRILLAIFILLLAIQFVPVKLPKVAEVNGNDLIVNNQADAGVSAILKASCYDCHSNQTRYPWYAHVAPVSWLVASDVKEGRRKLNFSEWTSYDEKRKAKKLGDIKEMVHDGDMPVFIYTIMHRNTSLNDNQRSLIVNWADAMGNHTETR